MLTKLSPARRSAVSIFQKNNLASGRLSGAGKTPVKFKFFSYAPDIGTGNAEQSPVTLWRDFVQYSGPTKARSKKEVGAYEGLKQALVWTS